MPTEFGGLGIARARALPCPLNSCCSKELLGSQVPPLPEAGRSCDALALKLMVPAPPTPPPPPVAAPLALRCFAGFAAAPL
eukprot:1288316-Lingulodinium_polyedra.AAC.1